MYTYKCEKCGKEFEIDYRLPEETYHVREENVIWDELWILKNNDSYCGGKLYRVYKPTYVVIKGVR